MPEQGSADGSNYTFWMLSLPLKHRELQEQRTEVLFQDRQILFTYLREKLVAGEQAAELYGFDIPEFKTGTLDYLVSMNDQLIKCDAQLESLVKRLMGNFRNVLEEEYAKAIETLVVGDKSPSAYIKGFTWNRMKYRVDVPIAEVMNSIVEEALQVDSLIRSKMTIYSQARSALNTIARRKQGSLINRDLTDVVKAEDLVLGSEYMESLLFVLHQNDQQEWDNSYEQLVPMAAVPRSAKHIAQEGDYCLYAVVVLKKHKESFIQAAQSKKFIPRLDFQFVAEAASNKNEESVKLESEVKSLWASLVRLLKANFGEVFACWIHLKVVRLHVESILRYGLPANFLAMILQPLKSEKKIRKIILHALEKLDLPGISQLELTTAQIQLGFRKALGRDDAQNAADAAEEAELWSALGEVVGPDSDPFVNLIFKWGLTAQQ